MDRSFHRGLTIGLKSVVESFIVLQPNTAKLGSGPEALQEVPQ